MMTKDDNQDGDVPRDLDTFWKTMNRRIANFSKYWRGCKSPRCRRMKSCVDARLLCERSAPPMTEEERAEVRASLHQALVDRMRRGGVAR